MAARSESSSSNGWEHLAAEPRKLGADYRDDGSCRFTVWAPLRRQVAVHVLSPHETLIAMHGAPRGYWWIDAEDVAPGTLYLFRLDDAIERPDPASHSQPMGVHGPSEVIDHRSFAWGDHSWQGLGLSRMILYEIHAGTFSGEGTLDAIIPRLEALKELGVNTLALMPLAQFPGGRNWGYDGVFPFAVQNTYGGPASLKRLVNACHGMGMAVVLDVVYNHLGPEGNYLWAFGPYFTDKYRSPWGTTINFDDAHSDEVRRFFVDNALFWLTEYHVDGLRLDAIHAIVDMSAKPFLQALSASVAAHAATVGRPCHVIAESDLNDVRVLIPEAQNGLGLDAQWSDDFHHSLHALLTGERQGYYADFGRVGDLVRALQEGFVYSGQYSVFRRRRHGSPSGSRPASQFVVFSQNHDQAGNRALGERLSTLVDLESLKLAAGVVLLSPYIPLLFMGEEYGEKAPFLYFVSHSDEALVESVRSGRRQEFKLAVGDGVIPDPQSPETFARSKINWELRQEGLHHILCRYYRELVHIRTRFSAFSVDNGENREAWRLEAQSVIVARRWTAGLSHEALCLFNFEQDDILVSQAESFLGGSWHRVLDSSDERWAGPGNEPFRVSEPDIQIPMRRRSVQLYVKGSP